ncbi:asparagine synthase (glutamine-hydrolyzing) [Limnohabitans sp. TS-CS-82]|uniref:asparagine synthase (glutamine-hydrolyzing) n=1 Tax=Limnohabitans sp. TS-CS-82 TaxID=2094193 RepID=UPI000CF22D34|nr:asparagine synthase (glutamine-hydrolyzing) [Limnohabitans sp. TS-CS-82]PQA81809.1 asparagine synthase (glutamine-hydrolyzing) [Limnohabitans sp. TS-CS-82]
MCGFNGFLGRNALPHRDDVNDVLSHMAQAIKSRGPDAFGAWADSEAGIALAHRRLAILDLTPAGAQPMVAAGGRYVLAFNGEIYNHLKLRAALGGVVWRGHSDTETLLAGFEAWGVVATLQRAIGMFAFALWDREQRVLTLGRDRMGEKPVYYGWQGQGAKAVFLFGSDVSALRCHPAFAAPINRDALTLYMRHNCIGGEHSIYQGIHKLLPGHLLTLAAGQTEPRVWAWWSAAELAERAVAHPFAGSPDQAVDALEALLSNAVGQQMVADVPLGAFLSGGVDSSTVVALMQAQSSRPVKTFSIGFHEAGYNEAEHAKAVAQHLGTDHTELYVSAQQALDVIPKLPTLYAEPFADSSQIPTYLVSQLARQHVTVSLSGDAGDELFCGYNRYQMTARLWGTLQRVPKPLRRAAAAAITAVPPARWDSLGRFLPVSRLGDKLHKGAALLGHTTVADLYRGMVSHWPKPDALVLGAHEPASVLTGSQAALQGLNEVERMMVLDMLSYLPDDILVKVDRAAMGVSLETRVPMLDHRVVEFAWSLPLDYKLRGGVTKWPLREVLYRHVPRSLIERPKMGFGVPIDYWLRGPLRDWAENLLSESRLRQEGFFNPAPIRQKWAEHLSGLRNWQYHLWDVLMFQAWLEVRS